MTPYSLLPIPYSSTFGTALSASSLISQSGAVVAPAIPATNTVGTCFCFVLYCVATSLYSCLAKAILFSVDVSSSCSSAMFPVALRSG